MCILFLNYSYYNDVFIHEQVQYLDRVQNSFIVLYIMYQEEVLSQILYQLPVALDTNADTVDKSVYPVWVSFLDEYLRVVSFRI